MFCVCAFYWRACPLSVSVSVRAAWHALCARMLLGALLRPHLPAAYARSLPISMFMPCAHLCAYYTPGALVRCLAHISRTLPISPLVATTSQPASCYHIPARVQTCLVFSHARCHIMLGTRPLTKHWRASSLTCWRPVSAKWSLKGLRKLT